MLAWIAAIALGAPLDPVVRVVVGSSACAGTLIDEVGSVLTAYHCVAAGGRARLVTRDGRTVAGRVRAWDVAADLAVIEAPELAGGAWLPVGPVPEVGSAVTVVGHPLASELPTGYFEGLQRWAVSSGIVSAVGVRAIQFDAAVNAGNSGGPVLDAHERLVSVVSRRLPGAGLGFGPRSESIAEVVAASPRRMGLGGQLALGVDLGLLSSIDGGVAIGPRIDLVVRDRLVLGGTGQLPIQPALSAARFGTASYGLGGVHGGLRQRVGHGPWTLRVEGLGGLAAVGSWTGAVEGERLAIRTRTRAYPWGGGAIAVRGVRFDLGVLAEGTWRVGVGLAWPGTLAVW